MEGPQEIEVISSVVWSGPWPNGKAVFETWNNKAEPPPTQAAGNQRLFVEIGEKGRLPAIYPWQNL
jgi:hypothetical protein